MHHTVSVLKYTALKYINIIIIVDYTTIGKQIFDLLIVASFEKEMKLLTKYTLSQNYQNVPLI